MKVSAESVGVGLSGLGCGDVLGARRCAKHPAHRLLNPKPVLPEPSKGFAESWHLSLRHPPHSRPVRPQIPAAEDEKLYVLLHCSIEVLYGFM